MKTITMTIMAAEQKSYKLLKEGKNQFDISWAGLKLPCIVDEPWRGLNYLKPEGK